MSNYTVKNPELKFSSWTHFDYLPPESPQNNSYLTITNKVNSTSVEIESFKVQKDFLNTNSRIFNFYILDNIYKIKKINDNEFSVYRVPNKHGNLDLKRFSNTGLASNSVNSRFSARNRLINIIKANTDFCYFFTGTFDPKKWNRKNFKELHSSLTHWLRRRGIKYILIPEPHKDGSIHFHGFFNETIKPYLAEFDINSNLPKRIKDGIKEDREIMNCPEYAKMFGWVSIERIRNLEACAVYVSKYVSKTFEQEESRFSYHRYFCSQGLNRPEFVLKTEKDYSMFSARLSSVIPKVSFKRRTCVSERSPRNLDITQWPVGKDFDPQCWDDKYRYLTASRQ